MEKEKRETSYLMRMAGLTGDTKTKEKTAMKSSLFKERIYAEDLKTSGPKIAETSVFSRKSETKDQTLTRFKPKPIKNKKECKITVLQDDKYRSDWEKMRESWLKVFN